MFSWLDGPCIVAYIGAVAIAIGGATFASLVGAARLAGVGRFDWKGLAMALVPLGGIGLFLGLSMLTIAQLRGEHIALVGIGAFRAALLAIGIGWSAWLGGRIVLGGGARVTARSLALALYAIPLAVTAFAWYLVFWRW